MRRGLLMPTLILALMPVLMLAGCSGGDEVPSLELQLIRTSQTIIAARLAPEVDRPALTRAALNTVEGAFIEVTLERRDQLAYLHVNASRRDGDPGQIVVWRSDDNITLAMRNGVLIATRGLGNDVLSVNAQVSGDTPGPARGGEKAFHIRDRENKSLYLPLVCDLADLGPETIEIVETRYATHHLRETCEGGVAGGDAGRPGQVVNDYWVDARAGLVWQSRQWAGPGIGYLRVRRLTR